MIVDAEIWYWTPGHMSQRPTAQGGGYITVRDAERMCEEAHTRGFRVATESCEQKLKEHMQNGST